MLKTVSLLFIFLFLTSCGGSGGSSNGGAPSASEIVETSAQVETDSLEAVVPEEVTPEAPVPSAALNFEVKIDMHNFDASQEDKVLEAAELIKKVVASEEFKNSILNHKVKGKKMFWDNGGLTNAQIYKKILAGSEDLQPGSNNQMDLALEIMYESSNTVGYTYPNTIKVWMNKKFLNKNKAWKVTTNMMHEWLHKLGFKHDKTATPMRKYSVPYAIGYMVAKLAKQYDI